MASHCSKEKDQKTLVYKAPHRIEKYQPDISSNQPSFLRSFIPVLLQDFAHTIKPFLPPLVKTYSSFKSQTKYVLAIHHVQNNVWIYKKR